MPNYNEQQDGSINILSYKCPVCGQIVVAERIVKYATYDPAYNLQTLKDDVGIHMLIAHNGAYKRTKKRVEEVQSKRKLRQGYFKLSPRKNGEDIPF